MDEWKPIEGYDGAYEMNGIGFRSVDRVDSAGRRVRGKDLAPWVGSNGYLYLSLFRNGKKKNVSVHSLNAAFFHGPAPEGKEVCHGKEGRLVNTKENLSWGTRSENIKDNVIRGTHNSSRKTECVRGHLLEPPNLIPSQLKRGARGCLSCNKAHVHRYSHPEADMKSLSDGYYRKIREGV